MEHLLLVLSLVVVAGVLTERDWLWRWDLLLYDASLALLTSDAPDDVVIVAIDEVSLAQLGRWPWSRRTHAKLVERLTQAGARVIALDILFTEPDSRDPGADAALGASLRKSGKVVLPVVLEQPRSGGQLLEQLPLPVLADAAASLGHVHFELDADGLARGTHLLEGLGDAHWPALSLAMLQVAEPGSRSALRASGASRGPARVWVRDHWVLVPYLGEPGSVARISYAQALSGRHPEDAFKGRFVLVGVTATGLGDSLPTPVSGFGQPMPGVEINANLLHALRNADELRPFPKFWRIAISMLLAVLPVVFYARLGPRYGLVAGLCLLAGVLVLPTVLLWATRFWFGPSPVAVVFVASYPLWSWLRLETAMRYLRHEMQRLRAQEADTPSPGRPQLESAMGFLSQVLPLGGWVVVDAAGQRVDGRGQEPTGVAPAMQSGEWRQLDDGLWAGVTAGGQEWRIGAYWNAPRALDANEHQLLAHVLDGLSHQTQRVPSDSVEVVQTQISRLQEGHRRLRELHAVINDGLEQMADAVVVTDIVGQVLVSNERASQFLIGETDVTLVGRSIVDLVSKVELDNREQWADLFRETLVLGRSYAVNARHLDGRDLLIQLAPLAGDSDGHVGLILNASDISELKGNQRRRAEMLSFLSHDLRSPLVSVLAVLELARARGTSEDSLNRVEAYTRSTIELAEQFVELVRAESQETLREEEVDLVSVATNAVDQVWAQVRAKQVAMESEFSVDDAWLHGDGSLLERALVNLLSNAIRHNPEGTQVRIEVSEEEAAFRVRVSDDGVGISEPDRNRLFQRFEQLTSNGERRQPGSGLGLAFVKVVADRHDAKITVDSTPGQGSVFALHFPRRGNPLAR